MREEKAFRDGSFPPAAVPRSLQVRSVGGGGDIAKGGRTGKASKLPCPAVPHVRMRCHDERD